MSTPLIYTKSEMIISEKKNFFAFCCQKGWLFLLFVAKTPIYFALCCSFFCISLLTFLTFRCYFLLKIASLHLLRCTLLLRCTKKSKLVARFCMPLLLMKNPLLGLLGFACNEQKLVALAYCIFAPLQCPTLLRTFY